MTYRVNESATRSARAQFEAMGHSNPHSVQLWDHAHLDMTAILARENCGGGATDPMRWHISLRGPGRAPHWDELVECVHQLRPGVVFVCGIPPRSWWMNLHEHVLHAWETGDLALIREFQVNARGDRPT